MGNLSPKITNACRNCTARCCRGLAVVLTIPEALRLLEKTGKEASEILEFTNDIDSRKTPHYPLLVRKGGGVEEWFIIIRRAKESCIFLREDMACEIYSARPFVCRLYPFELDGKEVKKGALCPVKFKKDRDIAVSAKELKKDLLLHEKLAREWVASAGSFGERPTAEGFCRFFERKIKPF